MGRGHPGGALSTLLKMSKYRGTASERCRRASDGRGVEVGRTRRMAMRRGFPCALHGLSQTWVATHACPTPAPAQVRVGKFMLDARGPKAM